MQSNLTLGEKIKNFRKRAGMKQLELELAIDASPGSISRIENNEVNPTKETLLKIIEILELGSYDAASIFNVDIGTEISKINKISLKTHENLNLQEMLDLITTKLATLINVQTAAVFIWSEKTQSLDLKSVNVPSIVRTLCEKIMGFPLTSLRFYSNSAEDKKNYHLKSFIEGKILESNDFYNVAFPVFKNKKIIDLLAKWLNFKLALHIPLIFADNKIGVLGILWNKEELTNGEYLEVQTFADQIAIAIYNAQKYDELNKKYLELKNKYGE